MKKESDRQLTFLMLRTIKFNAGIDCMTELGYSYEIISQELIRCFDSQLILEINGAINLTEKGEEEISRLLLLLKKQKQGWIDPEYRSKIQQIDKNFIYLPASIESIRNKGDESLSF